MSAALLEACRISWKGQDANHSFSQFNSSKPPALASKAAHAGFIKKDPAKFSSLSVGDGLKG